MCDAVRTSRRDRVDERGRVDGSAPGDEPLVDRQRRPDHPAGERPAGARSPRASRRAAGRPLRRQSARGRPDRARRLSSTCEAGTPADRTRRGSAPSCGARARRGRAARASLTRSLAGDARTALGWWPSPTGRAHVPHAARGKARRGLAAALPPHGRRACRLATDRSPLSRGGVRDGACVLDARHGRPRALHRCRRRARGARRVRARRRATRRVGRAPGASPWPRPAARRLPRTARQLAVRAAASGRQGRDARAAGAPRRRAWAGASGELRRISRPRLAGGAGGGRLLRPHGAGLRRFVSCRARGDGGRATGRCARARRVARGRGPWRDGAARAGRSARERRLRVAPRARGSRAGARDGHGGPAAGRAGIRRGAGCGHRGARISVDARQASGEGERAAVKILHLMSCRGWSSDAYWAARACCELERRGHVTTLGCKRGTDARVIDRARAEGVTRIETFEMAGGIRLARDGADLRELARALRDVDVVHVHRGKEHWLAVAASYLAGGRRPPIVRTRHIAQAVRPHAGNRGPYRRATALVVTVTEAIRRQYLASGLLPAERVVALPGGADVETYRPQRADPSVRERLGGGGELLVGLVSGLRVMKGHQIVIDALTRLV